MDREKAIDWIYGERLIRPIKPKASSHKHTIGGEKERGSHLWLLCHWLQLWRQVVGGHCGQRYLAS